ncbi:glycerophosphodiester phosphodiesterase [Paenibacillus cremeus]|nr:glycerophosphodiester phosphodiesterase family protein [Paenibacillus cremeus]
MVQGLAHRGYPKKYPENTLRSFQAGLDLGFSHLELDVHLSKDGVPVVIHDPTLQRTIHASGYVSDFTLEELKQFRCKGLDGTPGEDTIPTLEEVLLLARGKAHVDVELKSAGSDYPGLEEAVLDVIRKCEVRDEVFVASFDHYSIIRMRELDSSMALGLVIYGATPSVFPLMEQLQAKYLSVKYIYLTDDFVRECREREIQLIAWTVDSEQAMKQMRSRYPDVWICTNELERWKNAFAEA